MQILLILLAALALVAILLWYIYFKDSLQLEPTSKMGSMGGMEGAGKIRSSVANATSRWARYGRETIKSTILTKAIYNEESKIFSCVFLKYANG